MKWWEQPFAGFDVESTGVDPETDRIVHACLVSVTPSPEPPWKVDFVDWLIHPGIPIPPGATAVHGITDEDVRVSGLDPAFALDSIGDAFNAIVRTQAPVVAFNAPYDLTILDRELRRYGLPTVEERAGQPLRPVIDPYVLDKQIDKWRKGSRKLKDTCDHYKVRLDGAHDASFDAVAACRLAWRMVTYSRPLMAMTVDELHDAQVGWRRTQMAELRAYFQGKGRTNDAAGISEHWPMTPWPEQG